MTEAGTLERFSLAGGPLHRMGCRMGLVRDGTNSVRLGLAIGGFLWVVLVALAWIAGAPRPLFSLSLVGAHVRLLLVVPLFFVCESWLDPRVAAFVGTIVRSGVVPRTARPALASEIARTTRWNDAWLTEAACVAIAVLFSVSASRLHLSGTTAAVDLSRGASPAALWYWMVCLTIVRFLIIRWLLRLAFWSHLIWRLTRLGLHLVPTHPDGVGGLGYLEVVHLHFTPLVFAISAVQSAGLAEEFATQATTFTAIYPALALVLIVDAVLFLGPLLIVGPTLWACKVKGLIDYMEFAETYVRTFDTKWVAANTVNEEPLLGTADLQSLADLNNSLAIVRNMRVVPVTIPLVMNLAMAAWLPMLPLLLFKYPLADLAEKFFARLTGL